MGRKLAAIFILICITATFGRGEIKQQSNLATAPEGLIPILRDLDKSNGRLTPAIRTSYVDWAEREVTRALDRAGKTRPASRRAQRIGRIWRPAVKRRIEMNAKAPGRQGLEKREKLIPVCQ